MDKKSINKMMKIDVAAVQSESTSDKWIGAIAVAVGFVLLCLL